MSGIIPEIRVDVPSLADMGKVALSNSAETLQNRASVPNNPILAPEDDIDWMLLGVLGKISKSKTQPAEIVHIKNESALICVTDIETFEITHFTDKFYLSTFQEARNEKAQIIETFGEPHVSFFGERVKTYQGTGFVLEADSTNQTFPDKYRWASGLTKFYEEHLRGSKLAENNRIATIFIGNYVLDGYFLGLVLNTNAADPNKKQFSFNFLVKNQRLAISNELDVLYSIHQRLSKGSRARFLGLERSLKKSSEDLEKLDARLLTPGLQRPEERSILNQKDVLNSIISETLLEMKAILMSSPEKALEG